MLEFNATLIVSMISFVIFIIIMNIIFYKPILKVIDERKEYIDDKYNVAKNSKNQANEILEKKQRKLDETLVKSKKIIAEKVDEANIDAKTKTDNARAKSIKEIETAKNNLSQEEIETAKILENEVQNLANRISSKILGEIEALK